MISIFSSDSFMVNETCPRASHGAEKKSKASRNPFLVFTKLNHLKLANTVKVFLQ